MTRILSVIFLFTSMICCSVGHDYMIFVQTWPPTFCKFKNPPPCLLPIIRDKFTVHGVWDGYNAKPPSHGQLPTKFDLGQVAHLEPELNISWPNVSNTNDNQALWEHEWNVHGSWLNPSVTQPAYFELGLFWKNKFNLFDVLDKNGVHPDPAAGMTNDPNLIRRSIQSAIGFDPVLRCQNDHLAEVWLCIDMHGTQLISCPSMGYRIKDTCSSALIAFPEQ